MNTTLPNVISAFRVLCAPALLGLAWTGARGSFLLLFAVVGFQEAMNAIR